MVVRIRLSRFGNKHQPFYNICVSQARYVNFSSTRITTIHYNHTS